LSEITIQQLITAYTHGAFPMAKTREGEVSWYTADPRAIFPITHSDPAGAFHVPRSLKKLARQNPFNIRVNQHFEAVIRACAEPRPGDDETWINKTIINVFTRAHHAGFSHCVSAHDTNGELVGGIYGLALGGAFFAESMFSRVPNGSKLCLLHLVKHLQDRGFILLDVQFTNPHLEQFGVAEIDAADYERRLSEAFSMGRLW